MTDAETVKRVMGGDQLNGAQLAKATELASRKITATLNDFQVRQWCIEAALKNAMAAEPGTDIIKRADAFYGFIMQAVGFVMQEVEKAQ